MRYKTKTVKTLILTIFFMLSICFLFGQLTIGFDENLEINQVSIPPPMGIYYSIYNNNVSLYWMRPESDLDLFIGFNVYRDDLLLTENPILERVYYDYNAPYGTMIYSVRAVYLQGLSAPAQVTVIVDPLLPPINLTWEIKNIYEVILTWQHPEPLGATFFGYYIYLGGKQLNPYPVTDLMYSSPKLPPGQYTFSLRAVYAGGHSELVSIFVEILNFYQILNATVDYRDVTLNWRNFPDHDEFIGYNLYRNAALLTPEPISETSYVDILAPFGYHTYRLRGVFEKGVTEFVETHVVIEALLPPSNLSGVMEDQEMTLVWQPPSTKGMTFRGYYVYHDDMFLTPYIISETTFKYYDMPSGNHTYSVRAVYEGGMSEPAILIWTEGFLNPIRNLKGTICHDGLTLDWQEPSSLGATHIGYNVYRHNTLLTENPIQTLNFTDYDFHFNYSLYGVSAVYLNGESVVAFFEIKSLSDFEEDIFIIRTELLGNYPNPFNPETTIKFRLATSGNVNIDIFNIRGQIVRNILNMDLNSGSHEIFWDGKDDFGRVVSSGLYFYQMKTEDFVQIKRMVMMK